MGLRNHLIIWTHIKEEWKLCSSQRHGDNPITAEQALYAQAQREIEEIYSIRPQIPTYLQTSFYTNSKIHFQVETTSKLLRQWINTWGSVFIPYKQFQPP